MGVQWRWTVMMYTGFVYTFWLLFYLHCELFVHEFVENLLHHVFKAPVTGRWHLDIYYKCQTRSDAYSQKVDNGECGKNSHTLNTNMWVQSAGCRLCFTASENARKCCISVKKSNFFCGGAQPLCRPSHNGDRTPAASQSRPIWHLGHVAWNEILATCVPVSGICYQLQITLMQIRDICNW